DRGYTYEVRARWTENGREVERTKTVPVKANGVATVDFAAAAGGSRVDDIDRGGRGTDADRDRSKGDQARPDANPAKNTNPRPNANPTPGANPRPGGNPLPDKSNPDRP
ncbi:MAG TPA: hypothetical protein VFW33_11410, partial [Gemmataceae bacterium]|nr:hypothetical protein [Gemmataceae bacterium]